MNVVDLVAILPWYLEMAVGSFTSATSVARVLRLARVLRVLKLGTR